jgi:NAD+ synthase (glutamine-hydrolysing)
MTGTPGDSSLVLHESQRFLGASTTGSMGDSKLPGPNSIQLISNDSVVTVAACALNVWAMDFNHNAALVLESCRQAAAAGAAYRVGPELELCGYGCEDHFYEMDTIHHCWESLCWILPQLPDLICDFGMPVLHQGVRYNCRVLCQGQRILWIRPKRALADQGNYRESRYFTAYTSLHNSTVVLPEIFRQAFGQATAPFGVAHFLSFGGIQIGCESCEELWTPAASHIDLALRGVEIIANGSASYHELRKLSTRLELVVGATKKCGGLYLYANAMGCDGGRCYYDGGALIVCNGQVLARSPSFSLQPVQVITATVDINEIRSYRAAIPSWQIQAQQQTALYSSIECHGISLFGNPGDISPPLVEMPVVVPEEECCFGPACWLWDYLRRSGASGFFLPLSGGADSSSVATIVSAMCHLVYNEIQKETTNNQSTVLSDCRRICGKLNDEQDKLWVPSSAQDICHHVLHTTYMGTTQNSSTLTKSRAQRLASAIGSYHVAIVIDDIVAAILKVFSSIVGGSMPKFTVFGGSYTEDLALQNVQARVRMVLAYLFAQLLPWVRQRQLGKQSSGFLLVLGSSNVDEGLRGYMTKYDCSSADLNPIGAISKTDLKKMLLWAASSPLFGHNKALADILTEIANAAPTAELRPIANASSSDSVAEVDENDEPTTTTSYTQLDEEEMGMSYQELSVYGTLRKMSRCGPVSMYVLFCVSVTQ